MCAGGCTTTTLIIRCAHTHRCIGGRRKLIRRHDRDLVEISRYRCRAQWLLGSWGEWGGAGDDEGLPSLGPGKVAGAMQVLGNFRGGD